MSKNTDNENQKPTAIVCVVDKSGSMGSLRQVAIDAYNNFLKEQQEIDIPAVISLVLFDSNVTFVNDNVPLNRAATLSKTNYIPDGTTALFDAIANGISATEKYIGTDDYNVVFVILTDGQENASREIKSKEEILRRITTKRDDGWTFVYLSCDPNCFSDASAIGIPMNYTVSYTNNSAGYNTAYTCASQVVRGVRNGTTSEWTDWGITTKTSE